MNHLFQTGIIILDMIKKAGFEAYFVGGSVRDYLLKRELHDIDIVTSANVDEIEALFEHTIPLGKEHGTLIVRMNGLSYEVTSYRINSQTNRCGTLEEDLHHRDFTINAIAMNRWFELVDPLNGQHDVLKRLIRTVGIPEHRFKEDPLRIFRGIRFVSQLGFELEQVTKEEMKKSAAFLQQVAIERLIAEWEKLLHGSYYSNAIQEIIQIQLADYLPFLPTKEQLYTLQNLNLTKINTDNQLWVVLCKLMEIKDITGFLTSLRKSNRLKTEVQHIVNLVNKRESEGWSDFLIYQAGNSLFAVEEVFQTLYPTLNSESYDELISKREKLLIKNRKELAINGYDIQTYFNKKPGMWIHSYLTTVEKAVVEKKVQNEKYSILKWLERKEEKSV